MHNTHTYIVKNNCLCRYKGIYHLALASKRYAPVPIYISTTELLQHYGKFAYALKSFSVFFFLLLSIVLHFTSVNGMEWHWIGDDGVDKEFICMSLWHTEKKNYLQWDIQKVCIHEEELHKIRGNKKIYGFPFQTLSFFFSSYS